jgi:hypothetical protein
VCEQCVCEQCEQCVCAVYFSCLEKGGGGALLESGSEQRLRLSVPRQSQRGDPWRGLSPHESAGCTLQQLESSTQLGATVVSGLGCGRRKDTRVVPASLTSPRRCLDMHGDFKLMSNCYSRAAAGPPQQLARQWDAVNVDGISDEDACAARAQEHGEERGRLTGSLVASPAANAGRQPEVRCGSCPNCTRPGPIRPCLAAGGGAAFLSDTDDEGCASPADTEVQDGQVRACVRARVVCVWGGDGAREHFWFNGWLREPDWLAASMQWWGHTLPIPREEYAGLAFEVPLPWQKLAAEAGCWASMLGCSLVGAPAAQSSGQLLDRCRQSRPWPRPGSLPMGHLECWLVAQGSMEEAEQSSSFGDSDGGTEDGSGGPGGMTISGRGGAAGVVGGSPGGMDGGFECGACELGACVWEPMPPARMSCTRELRLGGGCAAGGVSTYALGVGKCHREEACQLRVSRQGLR